MSLKPQYVDPRPDAPDPEAPMFDPRPDAPEPEALDEQSVADLDATGPLARIKPEHLEPVGQEVAEPEAATTPPEQPDQAASEPASAEPAPHNAEQPAEQPSEQPSAPAPSDAQTQEEEDLEAQLAYQNLKRRREARKRKRIIAIAVAGVVVLVAIIIFVVNQANSAANASMEPTMATGTVYMGDFATTISANGSTEPLNSTVVTPEVDGIIEGLTLQEGDYVNEGDTLFTIKNESLDREVSDAEAELRSAERAVESANRAISDAQSSYSRAVDDYNNAVAAINSSEDGSSSGELSSFDSASYQSAISSAQETYDEAVSARDSAQAKVDEAKRNTEKRTVRAPVSGTIVSLNAKNGQSYGATTGNGSSNDGTLMQISDLSQMKVTVQVNEVDISSIEKGQQAMATFSAIPGLNLDATVEHIASVSSGSGSSDGMSMGMGGSGSVVTYAVDLVIPQPDEKLKPGMTATVTITTQNVPNTLIVPAAAIQDGTSEDGAEYKYVTVVDDEQKQQTHEAKVEVTMENSSEAAVTGELKDGDVVMLGGGASVDAAALGAAGAEAGLDATTEI